MVSFRQYQELNHNHSHYCPSCQVDLEPTRDLTETEIIELSCPTEDCPISICYCNGTVLENSVTVIELFKCAEDILSHFDEKVIDISTTPKDSHSFGTTIRKYIDTNKQSLSKQEQRIVENKFKQFAQLERTIGQRDYSSYFEDETSGKRVIKFHSIYALAAEVLVYTVVTDEFEEPRMIRYPKAYANYINEDNVTEYTFDFTTAFTEHYSNEISR